MMNTPHDRYCLCSSCWFQLARSAMEPEQFVERAKQHDLTEDQQKIVKKVAEESALQRWNIWVREGRA